MQTSMWKPGLFKQQNRQVVRIFRPAEAMALIENATVEDETGWTSSRSELKEAGFTDSDLKAWFRFLLFSGCRFSEAIYIHDFRDSDGNTLYQGNGTIWMPRRDGGKAKAPKSRTILFSYMGRKLIPDFLKSRPLPSDPEGMKNTLTALSSIMDASGRRIGLPPRILQRVWNEKVKVDGEYVRKMIETRQFVANSSGSYSKILKEGFETVPRKKEIAVIGATVRSFRKTWESWLTVHFTDTAMRDRIIDSQGHSNQTALMYYRNLGFEEDVLPEIAKMVEGFSVIRPDE